MPDAEAAARWRSMARSRFEADRLVDARTAATHAVAADPADVHSLRLLGDISLALDDRARAVAAYEAAYELAPDDPAVAVQLAAAYARNRDHDAALRFADHALALAPSDPEAHSVRGGALTELGRLDEARTAFETALAIDPRHPHAQNGIGVVHERAGRLREALAAFDATIERYPEFADARTNRAFVLLRLGRIAEGYRDYHWMMRTPARARQYRYARAGKPRWTGEPLGGRRLLLAQEQGFGDMVQMLRFLPQLTALDGPLSVEVKAPLADLVRRSFPAFDLLVDDGSAAPFDAFDVHLPMMQLPAVLGVDLATIPAPVPYLAVDERRVESAMRAFASDERRTIGIAWRGNPEHTGDAARSTTLADWAPLAAVEGARFIALQHGVTSAECAAAPFPLELPPIDLQTFDDTAALIAALDLTITVDTVTIHLAGALARPALLALPVHADYRWMLERTDSPWYPTIELVRQSHPGNWAEVFGSIAQGLAHHSMHHPSL